jgi:hypothetical protein
MLATEVCQWFIKQWIVLSAKPPSEISVLCKVRPIGLDKIELKIQDTKILENSLMKEIEAYTSEANEEKRTQKIFYVMREIDCVFHLIHSRNEDADIRAPDWVRLYQAAKLRTGAYGSSTLHHLVENGPLTGEARDEYFSGAELFQERFSALSVTKKTYDHAGRVISVDFTYVPNETKRGIYSENKYVVSKVGFFPLATLKEHQIVDVCTVNDSSTASFTNCSDVNENFAIGVKKSPNCHIGISPEFTMSEEQFVNFCESYINIENTPNLYLAGTGNTVEKDPITELPWNEARVINRNGWAIWRQRKIWPATIRENLYKNYQISAKSKFTQEANANGSSLIVADVENFGRFLILICQDIKAGSIVAEILKDYQPDWVLTPLLDYGHFKGRWSYQEFVSLNHLGPSKFIIANSGACQEHVLGEFECGACIGPHEVSNKSSVPARRYAVVKTTDADQSNSIEWSHDSKQDSRWDQVKF